MHSPATNRWIKTCLLVIFTLISFSAAFPQESQSDKELIDAINNAKNANYEQAIPVLKKYAEMKGLDDLKTLEINIYLNLSYLATKNEALDMDKVNALTDEYIEKFGITKNDTLRSDKEMTLLYFSGIINSNLKNYDNMVLYYSLIIRHYEENHLKYNKSFSVLLYQLAQGYLNLKDYKSAIETGQKAWNINIELFGEKNEASLKILNILYSCYSVNNDDEKCLEYVLKYVEISREIFGEKSTKYLSSLVNLYLLYSKLGEPQRAVEINLMVVNLEKDVLGEKNPDYIKSLSNLAKLYLELGEYSKALEIYPMVVEYCKEVLGEKHPDYLTSLNNLALNYSYLGDYQKALGIYLKVIEIGKEVWGEKHPDFLMSLNNLALVYSNLGNNQKALEIYLKIVEIKKEILGEKHPDYLMSLNNLAQVYSYLGDYPKAIEIQLKVVEIGKVVLGEKHPSYLTYRKNLALAFSDIGDYQKALEINLEVVELKKQVFGERHPSYLVSMNSLASDYSNIGYYQKALEIYQKVVEIGKDVLGEKHPDYLTWMNNLAYGYSDLGNYQKALEIYLKVAELSKEVLGEKHPDYLNSLNNLALVYSDLGDYPKAIEIQLKVVELEKQILGEKHPNYLTSLENLASVYSELGDYQKALRISLKVAELRKEVLGDKHPDYLNSLNNLAYVYSELGNYQKALEINLKVVELRKEVLGDKHPDYLVSLSNLATVYSELGVYKKALEINLKVVELEKQVVGEKHPDYLVSLNNLATGYSDFGDYQNALELYFKVTELRKKVLGEKHPDYIWSLNNLALTEFKLSKNDSALIHKRSVTQEIQKRMIENFSILTENQRELFWLRFRNLFLFSTLIVENTSLHNPESVCFVYDLSLFSKGLLLNTTLDFDKLIAEKGTPEAIAKFEELKLLKLEIQRLSEKPIVERYLNVDSLENIAQQKETELVKLSKEYGDYTGNMKINWKDVQAKLEEKDVAIEFVEYPTLTDTVKYAALVLRKGWQYPKMISLFRKDQIEEFIKQDKNEIYSNDYIGKQIKKLIWSPLEEFIAPGESVYFSAAGIIHQLAIENLPADDFLTLGDHYQMYRLSSTKELAIHQPEEKNTTAVLYGGLKYDLEVKEMVAESKKYEKKENLYAMRGYQNDITVRHGWKFLDGTKPEVDQISQLMQKKQYQVTEYTGETGNEESFKSLSGKKEGIIHIATHGFFLHIEESRKNLFMMQRMGDQQQERASVDPMLRSGLIMAGGNKAWLGEKIPDNIEDGVLTAKEISRMDLRGTDLVVLSACETGLGDVSSEGVFGLQRSFKQAGVQTLVMSLWEVSDKATSYMMTEFYKGLLSGKEKRVAFLEAKRKCKAKFPYPQYWAAFIMLD